MADQVVNMFRHFWWPSIIPTPDIYRQPWCLEFFWDSPILMKGGREWIVCPPSCYQDHAYLTWFSLDALYTVISQRNLQVGWCCLFWQILEIRWEFVVYLENTSWIKLFCYKNFFYGASTCSRVLGIIDPIYFEKKSVYMIFGYGNCFTNLIWKCLD